MITFLDSLIKLFFLLVRKTGETIKEFGFSHLDQHEANKDKKFEMIDTVIYGIATK